MKGFEGVELRGRKVRLEMTEPHKEKYSDKKKERFYGSKSKAPSRDRAGSGPDRGSRGRPKRY